jgi:uncharacterized membrane protein
MSPTGVTPNSPVRDDHREEMRLNKVISKVLVVGLLTAVFLLVVGAVLAVAHPGSASVQMSAIKDIPGQLVNGEPAGFLQLGLLVLLLTPFARVLALAVVFAGRRQWLFTGISLLVAVLLSVGVALGMSLG